MSRLKLGSSTTTTGQDDILRFSLGQSLVLMAKLGANSIRLSDVATAACRAGLPYSSSSRKSSHKCLTMTRSERQTKTLGNPTKSACRVRKLRVLREAAFVLWESGEQGGREVGI
jgi:hypothetical protein